MSAESQLPQPADSTAPGGGAAPKSQPPHDNPANITAPSRTELQAEVERTRAELAATIDALTTQLSVGYQAQRIKREAGTAAADAGVFLTGGGMPPGDPRRGRNVKVLLGSAAALAVVVTVAVARRVAAGRRSHA